MNLNRLNNKYLYIGCAVIIICIYLVIAIYSITYTPPTPKAVVTDLPTITPVSSSPRPLMTQSAPKLSTKLAIGIPGEFKVIFAGSPKPEDLTTTLAQSSLDPTSPSISVPFTASFSADFKSMNIKTMGTILPNRMYSIYVRLKSNNHIVVKKRFKTTNNTIVPILE